VFTFPSHVMGPGEVCRIYTNEDHPEWCGFNYGSGSAIWNNGGDCADLRDSHGESVHTYCHRLPGTHCRARGEQRDDLPWVHVVDGAG
jgi:hypothetical protein